MEILRMTLRACTGRRCRLVLWAAFVFLNVAVGAQTVLSVETRLKGVFLFNFAQFATWPPERLPDTSTPLIIGILGSDPFGGFLDEVVADETIQGHPIEIRRYTAAQEATASHILFIGKDKSREVVDILKVLKGHDVLTVSDMDDFTAKGGMLKFFVADNKLRFELNMKEYKSTNLQLSSRLMRLARLCCQ
jgi:hypothetical protein